MAKSAFGSNQRRPVNVNRPGYSVRAPYNNYAQGSYYGYNYRPTSYNNIKGSLCTNYNDYSGITLGQFYCPIEGFSRYETACCGIAGDEYCCSPNERHNGNTSGYFGFIGIIVVLFLIVITIILVFVNKNK